MLNKIKVWCENHAPFLLKDTMPVWLSILASILAAGSAAYGAYKLAPAINREYQIDEARSSHISRTTDSLNLEIIGLSQKVRRLNDALANNAESATDVRQDCLDLVTKLQWMLVDLNVILKSDKDKKRVGILAEKIDGVKAALDRPLDEKTQDINIEAMKELGEHTAIVLDRLYVASSLK